MHYSIKDWGPEILVPIESGHSSKLGTKMVIATAVAVSIVIKGGMAAAAGGMVGASSGIIGGFAEAPREGLAAAGAAAGAIVGAGMAESDNVTLPSAMVGAAAGGWSSKATSTNYAAFATGNVGLMILGAARGQEGQEEITWDCWRPVLRDYDSSKDAPLLKDVLCDSRLKEVEVVMDMAHTDRVSHLVVKNAWDDSFCINFLRLHSGQLAAHATYLGNM